MTEIIEYFKGLADKIGIVLERLSDIVNTLNLNISPVIEITDEEKTTVISLILSKDHQEVLPERNPLLNFIIKSSKDMWVRIFSGEESLMRNIMTGEAKISNLRANYWNCLILSILISSLISLNILKF